MRRRRASRRSDLGLYSDANEAAFADRAAIDPAPFADPRSRCSSRMRGARPRRDRPGRAARQIRAADRARLGAPSRRPPCRMRPATMRRWRSIAPGSRACASSSRPPRAAPRAWASTASKFTARTAICCTNSSRRSRTGATTSMAAVSRIACGFRSRCSTRFARRSRKRAPVWMRISASDWIPGAWDIEEAVVFSRALEAHGCGGDSCLERRNVTRAGDPARPNYQVPFARRIKAEVGIPAIAVGLITEPAQAEAILAAGDADAIALARAMLYDPRWPWHAAAALGARAGRRSNTGAASRGRICRRERLFRIHAAVERVHRSPAAIRPVVGLRISRIPSCLSRAMIAPLFGNGAASTD